MINKELEGLIIKTAGNADKEGVKAFCSMFGLEERTVMENHGQNRFGKLGPGYSALYRFIGIVVDTVPQTVWRKLEDKLMEVE